MSNDQQVVEFDIITKTNKTGYFCNICDKKFKNNTLSADNRKQHKQSFRHLKKIQALPSSSDSIQQTYSRKINKIKSTSYRPNITTINAKDKNKKEYLVRGYIRENYIKCEYLIPLNDMIAAYMGCISVNFDVCFERNKRFIFNNGTTFRRDGSLGNQRREMRMFLVGCSYEWCAGINEFKIKIVQSKQDAIGIIEDVNECLRLQNWVRQSSVRVYMLWGGGHILTGCNQSDSDSIVRNVYEWKANDIIKVVLNCYKWKVYFFANNRVIGSIKVAANRTYFPVIGSGHNNAEYQLIY